MGGRPARVNAAKTPGRAHGQHATDGPRLVASHKTQMRHSIVAVRQPPAAADLAAALGELEALLGQRLSRNPGIREQHGRGEAHHPPAPPDAVAFAHSTEEVAAITRVCAKHRVPAIPFGVGTSLEGHVAALFGGVSIDLSAMDKVLAVNAPDLDIHVQAGITRKRLNEHLRDAGLFFPIDPGADATLGGMAATGASGTNAVRYGTMRDNVLGLTAVTADGTIVRTGGRARKSSAGYDLTRLLIGSEGTLATITELHLKLQGLPESMAAAVCPFPDFKSAVMAVIEIIQTGIPVARIEFLDGLQMEACIAFSKLENMAPVPTLFFEFHGTEASVRAEAETAGAICQDHGGSAFAWAVRPEERSRLWQARHDAYYAALALRPGRLCLVTDVCVPISSLADAVAATRADLDANGLTAPIVGHVGDGNFHVLILIDPDDANERARAEAVSSRMVANALSLGGTCTGEHGVGYGKMKSLAKEHGDLLPMMRAIKAALDPDNIMNPGKLF